jgi:predicted permease
MRQLRALVLRIFGLFRPRAADVDRDTDFNAELESHVALHTEDGIRSGLSPAEARRQALIHLGGAEQTRQAYRERRTLPWLESLIQDLRYALRQLVRSPGFALAAILTLALAIGANTAIFSVVNAILRHPAGVDHPERVAVLNTRYSQFSLDFPSVSVPVYALAASMKAQVQAAAIEKQASYNIGFNGVTEHLSAARISSQWFQVYGATPILGRVFTSEEDQPNQAPVVVLSYGLWQRAFGGRSDAVGQTMMLDQKQYRVIGVMRSDFSWPRRFQAWTPIALPVAAFSPDEAFNEDYQSTVRLLPGVSVAQFNAAFSTRLWDELRRGGGSRYATSSGWSVYSASLTESAAGPLRKPLYVLFGVVGLILLIASANVAGLLLARASSRSKEFAIRIALGAGALRILQQLLIETSLLAGVAAALGIAAGPAFGRLVLLLVPHHLAQGYVVEMEPAVLVFTAATALITALIAGLGPAVKLIVERKRLQLHEGSRAATASADRQRMRRGFVVAQVALSFLLLSATGLFLVSLQRLQRVDPGFNPHGILAGQILYAGDEFKKSQPRQAAFVRGAVENLAAQPGVLAAAAVEPLLFDPDDGGSCSFAIIGRPLGPNDPGPHSQVTFTTPDYLKVMQIPLLSGRWITAADTAATEPVAVVDQRLAKEYWPNRSPIGQHISFDCSNKPALVIGVVATVRLNSLEEDTSDGMRYYPFAQGANAAASLVARTSGDPTRMASALRNAVASADPSQTVTFITSLETLVSDSLAGRRLIVSMLAAFAALALLLAMVGIYGLISFVTANRTNEIGIRMALGAKRADVVWLVLRSALSWVVVGLSLGVALSIAATVLLRHEFVFFGGGTVASLAVSGVLLFAIATFACLLPARRAASINPMKALRTE